MDNFNSTGDSRFDYSNTSDNSQKLQTNIFLKLGQQLSKIKTVGKIFSKIKDKFSKLFRGNKNTSEKLPEQEKVTDMQKVGAAAGTGAGIAESKETNNQYGKEQQEYNLKRASSVGDPTKSATEPKEIVEEKVSEYKKKEGETWTQKLEREDNIVVPQNNSQAQGYIRRYDTISPNRQENTVKEIADKGQSPLVKKDEETWVQKVEREDDIPKTKYNPQLRGDLKDPENVSSNRQEFTVKDIVAKEKNPLVKKDDETWVEKIDREKGNIDKPSATEKEKSDSNNKETQSPEKPQKLPDVNWDKYNNANSITKDPYEDKIKEMESKPKDISGQAKVIEMKEPTESQNSNVKNDIEPDTSSNDNEPDAPSFDGGDDW